MKQNITNFFICLTITLSIVRSNQICQDFDTSATSYAKVAYFMATKYVQFKDDLDNSVVQIFDLIQPDATNAGVNRNDIENNKFSFNVYKFTSDQGHQEKKKQLEANLRYMLFFRGAFDYKYLSNNGCFIKEDKQNNVQYVIIQFPGERILVNDWFGEFRVDQNTKLTFLEITQEQLLQKWGNKTQYQRKAVGFNPFFAIDFSLQFLIAVAKMHEKNILHLNLKPFNLKLLNRFCLALDNFESSLYSIDSEFESYQSFSIDNPYNGKNLVDEDTNNFDFTDDLHSSGLVIYQLCTFRTLPNDQLLTEIKNGFDGLNDMVKNQALFEATKNWCGKVVYNLLNSNERMSDEDLAQLKQYVEDDDEKQLNNGKDAVKDLLEIMIEMKNQNGEQFQNYYTQKLQYLQGSNLSQSTIDVKQQIMDQTNLVKQIITDGQVNDEKLQQLLQDQSIDQKLVKNIFITLPIEDSILDVNTQFEMPEEFNETPQSCQNSQNDIELQCLDDLLTMQIVQNEEDLEIKQVFQQKDYQNGLIMQKLDENMDGYGYSMNIFNNQPAIVNKQMDDLYVMI